VTVGEIRPAAGDRQALDRFLSADSHDPGCDRTTELLHSYAELASAAPRRGGTAAPARRCAPAPLRRSFRPARC